MMNMENAKTQTFGVEIEMNNLTRREAAKLAAEFFGTGRYEDTARRNGYCTWSAWMADGREFIFTLAQRATPRRPSATWPTLWQATRA